MNEGRQNIYGLAVAHSRPDSLLPQGATVPGLKSKEQEPRLCRSHGKPSRKRRSL
jgi:hypothetical protein